MASPAIRNGSIGLPRPRVEGRLKVTGEALYPSDIAVPNPAHAVLVTSSIAKGKIRAFHLAAARAVPGVLDILTFQNTKGAFKTQPNPGGVSGGATTSLESAKIWHDGQIIAVVVADTYEGAREAAQYVRVDYDSEIATASFDRFGATEEAAADASEGHEDPHIGDAQSAYADAAVKIDAHYATPPQHHNPLELFDTTCIWTDGKLTILEA